MSAAGTYNPTICPWCNGLHLGKCPLVKAIEYFHDGTIKHVEFHGPVSVPANGDTKSALSRASDGEG